MKEATKDKLLLSLGMAAGIGIYGIVENFGTHKFEPTPQECRELQTVLGSEYDKEISDQRNKIYQVCATILSENPEK